MIEFTERQRQAIETVDGSVMVTAAAGSGKTAVLAERCAHLVCDLPPGRRCGVDELLVVTFTEAAAAEMKGRILQAIRQRLRARSGDGYLRTQAALIDTARISTQHSFCLWMLRRWFSEASIDPAATILQEDEARLLCSETVEALFSELYGADTELGRGFVRLVDHYSLGNDTAIAAVVTKLHAFLRSLPDPLGWLTYVRESVGERADRTMAALEGEVRAELGSQQTHVQGIAALIERQYPLAALYGHKLSEYAEALARWSQLADWDGLREEIDGYKLSPGRGVRVGKDAPQELGDQRDAARELFVSVQKRLFNDRLKRLARFSRAEMLEGLTATRPYLETLGELVTAFGQRYQRAKKGLDVLDFADLERGAYRLLCSGSDPQGLSDVARDLQDRFAHVLVDEFQDINPLQAAILHLVSRESDAGRPDNLFCVGDVKQSIYRFRLAEPELFQRRIDQPRSGSACVRLQENFRSAGPVIDGINLLFEQLMTRQVGGVDYDESVRLRAARPDAGDHTAPIELHLLQRRIEASPTYDDPDFQRTADPADPAQWEPLEREAYLIGQRMHELRASGMTVNGEPLQWRDMVVLLRSVRHTAQPLADVLARMGIPAFADAGNTLLGATEVNDVLALLHVLDNQQQDIPLASVLRSGVTGVALSEDDLVAVRCIDRTMPFHEAVRRYARSGEDAALVERLCRLLDRIARWRREARRRPVADVLWKIYRESGCLAYVGGLTQGRLRRGNLLALHERARQFGGFRRQGLHRFLRFIESLEGSGEDLAGARPLGQAQNGIPVMSIHRSKGLEFPVVFVADLGRRFNLRDARSRIIFDRHVGIGLRVVDPELMIEYPSVQHQRVVRAIESATRDEELRVLYVALTRARERLILTGSADLGAVDLARSLWSGLGGCGVSPSTQPAGTPLEWIVPALAAAPAESVRWLDQPEEHQPGRDSLWRVALHTDEDVRDWQVETGPVVAEKHALLAAAKLDPLPAEEPRHASGFDAGALLDRLDYAYPHLAASSVRAVLGASEAKRAIDPWVDDHQPRGQPHYRPTFDPPDVTGDVSDRISAQQRGTLTHRVLERIDWRKPVGEEFRRLVAAGAVTDVEAQAVDGAALEWFAETPLGRRVRDAGTDYRREFSFISVEPASVFDPALEGDCEDTVLVRGIADGVLIGAHALEVIDFKTDAVGPDGVADRAARYATQMRLYARAVSRIWRQPVTRCWLVFLAPRIIVEMPQE